MQTISEADHQLIREKLPIILHYARSAIPRSDIKSINAARRLLTLTNKLNRKHPKQPKQQ